MKRSEREAKIESSIKETYLMIQYNVFHSKDELVSDEVDSRQRPARKRLAARKNAYVIIEFTLVAYFPYCFVWGVWKKLQINLLPFKEEIAELPPLEMLINNLASALTTNSSYVYSTLLHWQPISQ